MQALILESPGKITIGDIDTPQIKSDEVLLASLACGICGGDIKVFKGIAPFMGRTLDFPRKLGGHEFAGRVIAVGKDVTGLVEGDVVARCFGDYCGKCLHCRLGRPNFCLNQRGTRGGGFAAMTAIYAPEQGGSIFKLPPDISIPEAALCEPLTCAIGAVLKAVPQPGDRFAVIGLGGMGQFVAQILASAKVHVIGIDLQAEKLQKAAAYCAEVIDASQHDVVDEVMRRTGGVGVDAAMEVVGIPATVRQALEMPRMGGRIVIVGAHTQLADGINVDRIFRRDLTIQAAKGPSPLVAPDGVPLAFRYIQEGIARPKELLTEFSFHQAQDAFEGQVHGSVVKGVISQM